MAPSLQLLLLLGTVSLVLTKYVYVDERKYWPQAQSYCEIHHTDLAPVNSYSDMELLRQLTGPPSKSIWIGLLRNKTHTEKWRWSGGGEVTKFFWNNGEPNGRPDEKYGFMNHLWYDVSIRSAFTFICFSVHVVREEKTWEEAIEYCRQNHTDLASISSETELMLIQKELNKKNTTEHVWIGLRFLAGDWLWLDQNAGEYEAWGHRENPNECPIETCGALMVNNQGVHQWNAHDCVKKMNFVCY
ncbi:unnamed protein product [Knipowitschia caucasica]|uniref:C-type lectin domain-containing protein n=1 Tax=Knipowitschia caucasica TaxID=637954 RepID=A0AAV2L8P6_KNICA